MVIFQALLLLSYLVRNGSSRVVASARDHLVDLIDLEDYRFRDENDHDKGINGKDMEVQS